MLIDEAELHIKAGHGGAGKVIFDTVPRNLGPTGGDGGNGGNVYVLGVSDFGALRAYRYKKDFSAESGKQGGANKRTGAAGDDLILKVPIGTVIHVRKVTATVNEKEMREIVGRRGADVRTYEVTRPGERVMIAQGGKGGRGNFRFRSAHNTSPEYAQPGLPGDEFEAIFELQLIADVGLIGLPNAGKSSLLNELTKAGARVAAYPFTTLEPNLGVLERYNEKPLILADIPGLIEGASSGKGLGYKFLRHIERTKVLLHCVSVDSASPVDDYKAVRAELTKYDKELAKKPERILLTKSDTADSAVLKKSMVALRRFKKPVSMVSIHDTDQLEACKKMLCEIA